jgi:LuxR family transcriptional regulator of csgAB operon
MQNMGMGHPLLLGLKIRFQDIKVVWFNADRKGDLEYIALEQGVRGILYANQPAELYALAAKTVLSGELWYPREILEKILIDKEAPVAMPTRGKTLLTRRERGILKLVASGMNNREIAGELCISTYTVKTHIYNIYRKIGVDNRFKAIQWLYDDQTG